MFISSAELTQRPPAPLSVQSAQANSPTPAMPAAMTSVLMSQPRSTPALDEVDAGAEDMPPELALPVPVGAVVMVIDMLASVAAALALSVAAAESKFVGAAEPLSAPDPLSVAEAAAGAGVDAAAPPPLPPLLPSLPPPFRPAKHAVGWACSQQEFNCAGKVPTMDVHCWQTTEAQPVGAWAVSHTLVGQASPY